MKTKNIMKCFMVAATMSVIFTACKKKDTTPAVVDSDTSGAAENALSEGTFNDVSNISDQAAAGNLSSYLAVNNGSGSEQRGLLSVCATVTRDTTVVPHTITVNFGTTPCLCADGRFRSGIITISYSGHYYDIGATIAITFTNYKVNGNLVNGTHSIVNNGPNINGHPVYTIDVNGTIVKANNGGTITWMSHRVREWTAGYTTTTGLGHFLDDVYSITGSSSGSNSNGSSYSATILSPLMVHLNCFWIESGVLQLVPSGKPTRTIDFGPDGTCDNHATVTINGTVYNINI